MCKCVEFWVSALAKAIDAESLGLLRRLVKSTRKQGQRSMDLSDGNGSIDRTGSLPGPRIDRERVKRHDWSRQRRTHLTRRPCWLPVVDTQEMHRHVEWGSYDLVHFLVSLVFVNFGHLRRCKAIGMTSLSDKSPHC